MTRFEEIGRGIQLSAYSKKQAERSFVKSCEMCCTKGIRIDCERCAIACAHKSVIETFDAKKGISFEVMSLNYMGLLV